MVTKREKIEYYDLKISVEPAEEKPFYLTGDSPSFNIVIDNETSRKRKGKLLVRWMLAEVLTLRIVKFELGAFSKGKYGIPREWLYREGTAVYELIVMPQPPEYYVNVPDQKFVQGSHKMPIHPLCSYYVRDKDRHKYEERHRKITIGFSVLTIFLTIINLMLVILGAN